MTAVARLILPAAPVLAAAIGLMIISVGCATAPASPAPVPAALRLQVSLTADELAAFRPALEALDEAHPEFTVALEAVPQQSEAEKTNTLLAGGDMPDVLRLQGLNVQQWIRRGAFVPLDARASESGLDLDDFYAGPLDQFRWNGSLYGIPDTASPELVFYNESMFEAAGLDPPTDQWTYDDMREAAILLTLDGEGRRPTDPGFDPDDIVQWGWNGGLTYFWQNAIIKARGGDLCANADCTLMDFTSPENLAAIDWWVSLVRDDHAALYDPFGGSQTGVPGDPLHSGNAAMGTNGSFAIGQLNSTGAISYDVVAPLLGVDGRRYASVSTNGYVISATTAHPDEAWALVQALTEGQFLADTWGLPGHAVPARKSVAGSAVDLSHEPANQAAVLAALEVGEVFRPSTSSGFAAYGATVDLFRQMNTGVLTVAEGAAQLEAAANEALAADRGP